MMRVRIAAGMGTNVTTAHVSNPTAARTRMIVIKSMLSPDSYSCNLRSQRWQ